MAAGNEWINGYLEAILDTGEKITDHKHIGDEGVNDFKAAKYFVETVTGFDESSLYRTWIKSQASATRSSQERTLRMEHLCWRIWHIARKKRLIEWEDAHRLARRHMEREQGRKDATADMSSDLSEGEKESIPQDCIPRVESALTLASSNFGESISPEKEKPEKRLYIVLISLHGLVRGDNMELGRDSDTGGQIKYVVELARALALMPEVYRVDLLTRQICSPDVDWSYGEPTEMLSLGSYDDFEDVGESSGAYIVRIPCGPRDQYLRKELLWPYIQEFVDGALTHILNMTKVLGEQIGSGGLIWPHVIHGHYADAGDIASLLSGALDVPMVLTGHSLGRNKLEQLLKQGRQSKHDINATYKIMRRIEAEELSLDAAELVITSTKQEIEEQWGLYDGFDVKLERVLRARARRGVSCHGRYMPRMVVIPPGMDFSNVIVQDTGDVVDDGEAVQITSSDSSSVVPVSPRANPPIWDEIMRFLTNPHKPMILALARPDPKKNLTTLLRAFGERRALRELANLTLIMGNRDDIDEMSNGNAAVMTTVLKLIDKYDLYGQIAYPKHHKQSDVPEIYRFAAKTKGVFINPALVEPFGLTLIEAAAHGLPMVATKNGGPVDIHKALSNGLLVDPHNEKEIADALLRLVADRSLWNECRKNGLKNIHLFSWPEHCRTYLSRIALSRMRHPQWKTETSTEDEDLESQSDSLRDVQDFSLRLSVDGNMSISNPADLERMLKSQNSLGKNNGAEDLKPLTGKQRTMSGRMESMQVEGPETKRFGSLTGAHKAQPLKKRRRLVVIAVDGYDPATNNPSSRFVSLLQDLVKNIRSDSSIRVQPGLIISSALTKSEIVAMLNSAGLSPIEFDALICSSGSEVYYPASHQDDNGATDNIDLHADKDYSTHIDYRWGYEGLRKTMARLNKSDAENANNDKILIEDTKNCNSHCLAYSVTNSDIAPTVDQLRQRLRMRGLRCHVMFCRNSSRLHVLPLLASRSQSLRYFFARWNVDVANMFVVLGETGDTDYEELLSGTHKTIIVKDIVEGGSEKKLRATGNYGREDVAPAENSNMIVVEANATCDLLLDALK
uniref:Sucrose-phosphate synthase n=1 Tax=Physcomitrium patens TaxID=3218 RepID=Q3Y543_PHYPA|nr:sucrose-phosphate synthase 2 [Physcomitrium patens]